ncbi:zinc finger protein 850-like [Colossoma macropomum]|uniref:zinc finger protein 850-like n=1 Tax=Colossoma macropomum TaxID=42526 RepID=UPI001863C0CE|nr:zinc finger protein 850-like [Colossoma macropomum]XP_036449511.1 zinc finger protein 850-like [Colossoma macropomum]
MLGLRETKSVGTPSSKTYSCVACSATFKGLSSLLVHQTSHASEISDHRVTTLPTCSHCGSLFASPELLQKHHCMVLPPPVTQDVYVCDHGEEFHELGAIQEHKKLHEIQMKPQSDETSNKTSEGNETLELVETSELAQKDCSQPVPDEVPSNENSPSHCTDESLHQNTQTASEECLSTSDSPSVHNAVSQVHHDEGSEPSDLTSPLALTEAQGQSFGIELEKLESENTCVSDSKETVNECQKSRNKKPLLKMLTLYMNSRQSTQKQSEQSKRTLPTRRVSPRAPVQAPAVMSASSSGYFINNVRQKVAKYGPNRVGFRQSGNLLNVKPVKKKKKRRIVSTTKTLYPVVAIEACQQLVRENIEGKHQCGLCRRVFQDMDSLIMHHALHKKERVKFCRRCRQYVLSVISVPHNHICASSNVGFSRHFTLLTSNSPTTQHSQKLFHCTMCNRSYTRRHSLNKHNCQWIAFLKSSAFGAQKNDMVSNFEQGSNAEKQLMSVQQDSSCQVNVGVNTEGLKLVKTEELNTDSSLEGKYQTGLLAKRFSRNAVPTTAQDKMSRGSNAETGESLGGSQCTVPLDDAEIDVMDVDEEKHDDLMEAPKDSSDEVVVLEPTIKCPTSSTLSSKDFQVQISASGVKRFLCNSCQKSYSRRFTLKRHLEICGARNLMGQHSFGQANIIVLKKKFPCPNCGVSFTRKDSMNMHRKRCQSVRGASTLEVNKLSEKKNQASQENTFVLPPVSKNQVRQESSNNNSGSGNWGIMSLPSVLPRKVTCECGAAFTCPRFLFEHLQMHAMESYICSHCGENLQSWADFQAHQKFHAQTSGQKNEQKVSQPQQPQLQQVPRFQSSAQNQKNRSQDLLKSHLNHRHMCHRCTKVFRARKSLLRHLRLSCRGDIAGQNKHSCSRCGMTFQSPLAHKVHIQGNTCTPSFKPVRCPVCVRWFSCMDGLKRHLVSHSQQKVLTCQICEHKCSSYEDLEEHKRRVHGTKEAAESPTIQSAHVSQSNPSNAFQCQMCQRSYSKLQSLKDHLRKVHRPQGLNPGSVGVLEPKAGGLQSSKGTLQQSHSNPFQCHICSRSYTALRSLRNHRRRVHCIRGGLEMFREIVRQSQGNPYRCQSCHRSYRDTRSLKNHRRRVHCILGDVPESAKVVSTDVKQSEVKSVPLDVTLSLSTAPETAVQKVSNEDQLNTLLD